MSRTYVWPSIAALSLLIMTACVSGDERDTAEAEPPFIDPVILSDSMCRSSAAPAASPSPNIDAAPVQFDYHQPFDLPAAVKAHFHVSISTAVPEAQNWFDTGLAHMANFNHDEAIAAFRRAQEIDPACAMCFWGEGLSFGSNINVPYEGARGAAGRIAAQAAIDRLAGVTAREQALIQALGSRYVEVGDDTVAEDAAAFADAMDAAAQTFPTDTFILSLAAEANMDTQPWDYWEADARTPKGRTARTLALLEAALAIDPDFAPAIHLYIHITESSVDPYRAEPFADRLQAQALGVGHLVHMPSHIYLRLGEWRKSHAANIAAIAADEAYIAGSQNAALYASIYYPHNVHFVVASAQFAGDAETAKTMAAKLADLPPLDAASPAPFAEHILASQIFTDLLFSPERTVLETPEPAASHLYLRAAWHYARGSVFARQGEIAAAKAELAHLDALEDEPGFAAYAELFAVPLPGIVEVARLTLDGRILAAEGDLSGAIDRLESATVVEAQIPYFEPTWWYYPTRQTLGLYLLQDGQYDRAERAFYQTLIKAPNNAYALYGLAETFRAAGDTRSEDYARALFREAWMGGDDTAPELDQL